MSSITSASRRGNVPVARRQLLAEPAKLVVTVVAVAAAVALVLLLTGLRRGIGEQVTTYLDRQPPVVVAQAGTSGFLSQTSVLDQATVGRIAAVPGVADAAPITQGYAMLELHGRRVLTLLVGYDRGRRGGPWSLAAGREPRAGGEVVLDRVLAEEHRLAVGSTLRFRGAALEVVGLSAGTSGFMTPLAFTTRATANALDERSGTASFVLVTPAPGVAAATVVDRLRSVPGATAGLREELAERDRGLFVGAFSGPLLAMVAIAAAVAVLVIALTVYGSTRDRAREYATLKAIGLGRGALLGLVATQAAALAVVGTAVGVALASVAARGVAMFAPKYLIALTASDAAWMAVAAVVFALLAGLVPARYLAHLDPASAYSR